jgi:ParB family chromosome partitioning protein
MSTPNTTPRTSVLGKGLASLLPPTPTINAAAINAASNLNATPKSNATQTPMQNAADASHVASKDRLQAISMLPVEQIKANEFQPRREFDLQALEELSQSIKENGLIQPLVVRKNGDAFELIAGERRLRASKMAGLKMVPVVLRKSTDREALEIAIVENIQRVDLNCVDEALAYFQLMQEFQLSQEELGKKMGKDRATVANSLRILKLSDVILSQLKKGALSRGHAKALLAVENPPERERLAQEIIEKNLSVRQAEKRAVEIKNPEEAAKQKSASDEVTNKKTDTRLDPEIMRFTQALTKRFMTRTEIKGDQKSGLIQIQYGSKEELYRILNLMVGE